MSSEPSNAGGVATADSPSSRDRAEATRRGMEAAFNHGDFGFVREFT